MLRLVYPWSVLMIVVAIMHFQESQKSNARQSDGIDPVEVLAY